MGSSFAGRSVIVTGGSRGIGRALALHLAEAGARVAISARDAADLERTARECRARGAAAVVALPGDVAREEDCRRLVGETVEAFGGLDALVANAGISMVRRFDALADPEPLERIVRVNYLGAVYCTFHALPHLRERRGRLVAVASLAALAGVPTRTGYAASKHAMAGFFDSLRIELRDTGVSVTVAYPGFVDTGIRERAAGEGAGRGSGPAAGRLMSPEECARRILAAAARRRREDVMTVRGRVGRWLRLVAPELVDRIAARAVGV